MPPSAPFPVVAKERPAFRVIVASSFPLSLRKIFDSFAQTRRVSPVFSSRGSVPCTRPRQSRPTLSLREAIATAAISPRTVIARSEATRQSRPALSLREAIATRQSRSALSLREAIATRQSRPALSLRRSAHSAHDCGNLTHYRASSLLSRARLGRRGDLLPSDIIAYAIVAREHPPSLSITQTTPFLFLSVIFCFNI